MNCTEARERIECALDDAAAFDDATRNHVDTCAACKRHLDEMTALGELLSDEARAIVAGTTAHTADDVIAALDSPSAPKTRSLRRLLIALACAAGLLVALGALRRARERARGSPGTKRLAAVTFSSEQREALYVLERAHRDLLAELAPPVKMRAPRNAEYGQQLVDVPLAKEIDGIESSVRSVEAFLLECLPIPAVAPTEGGAGSSGAVPAHHSPRLAPQAT